MDFTPFLSPPVLDPKALQIVLLYCSESAVAAAEGCGSLRTAADAPFNNLRDPHPVPLEISIEHKSTGFINDQRGTAEPRQPSKVVVSNFHARGAPGGGGVA